MNDTLRFLQEEVERLRGLIESCSIYLKEDETPAQRIERERADTEAVLKLLLKDRREIERLRDGERAADAEIMRLREEATQLRQAVGVLTTLHPTMEIDVNNPVQMALGIVSYVTESRDAEIERLRHELEIARSIVKTRWDEIERLRELCIDFMVPMDVVNGLRKAGRPFGWEGE